MNYTRIKQSEILEKRREYIRQVRTLHIANDTWNKIPKLPSRYGNGVAKGEFVRIAIEEKLERDRINKPKVKKL